MKCAICKKVIEGPYYNFKYVLSFPGKDKTMVYDRERLAWMGPWNIDANLFALYYNGANEEKWLFGDDGSANIYELGAGYADDAGTAINTILRTKKED